MPPNDAALAMLPQGRHVVRVLSIETQRAPWRRSAANPAGEVLAFRLGGGQGFAVLFADIPTDKNGLLWVVAKAFGVEPDELTPDVVVGRECIVIVEHVTTRRGVRKPIVTRWQPLATEDTPKDKPPQRRSRNALRWPEQHDEGDVPF